MASCSVCVSTVNGSANQASTIVRSWSVLRVFFQGLEELAAGFSKHWECGSQPDQADQMDKVEIFARTKGPYIFPQGKNRDTPAKRFQAGGCEDGIVEVAIRSPPPESTIGILLTENETGNLGTRVLFQKLSRAGSGAYQAGGDGSHGLKLHPAFWS